MDEVIADPMGDMVTGTKVNTETKWITARWPVPGLKDFRRASPTGVGQVEGLGFFRNPAGDEG